MSLVISDLLYTALSRSWLQHPGLLGMASTGEPGDRLLQQTHEQEKMEQFSMKKGILEQEKMDIHCGRKFLNR